MFMYTPPKQKTSQYKGALAHALSGIRAYKTFSSAGAAGSGCLQLKVSVGGHDGQGTCVLGPSQVTVAKFMPFSYNE